MLKPMPPRMRLRRAGASTIVAALIAISSSAFSASAAPSRPAPYFLSFSGYRWRVIEYAEPRGPGPTLFDRRNAFVDSAGRLALETSYRDGRWTGAQLFLDRSLGYGSYELVLAPMARFLDDTAVLGFYTWDEDPAWANRELDIELARWGISDAPNLNFVVQPADRRPERAGLAEFDFSARTTLRFEWTADRVRFYAENELGSFAWEFPGPITAPKPFGVPPRGRERVGLNLWLFEGRDPALADSVVIESFAFKKAARR